MGVSHVCSLLSWLIKTLGRKSGVFLIVLALVVFILGGVLKVLFGFSVTPAAVAAGEFTKKLEVQYQVDSSGETQVSYDIRLENNFSTVYAKEYALELYSSEIDNVNVVDSQGKSLPFTTSQGDNTTTVRVTFPEDKWVVGRGQEQVFKIEYTSNDAASKYGQVLEVAVPKLAEPDQVAQYKVTIIVPDEFGEPSLVEPTQYRFEAAPGNNVVQFTNVGMQNGISVLFGDSQTYDLNLRYHLSNTSQNVGVMQIALPPDTAWQRVKYQQIDPQPETITADFDGNWIAEFRLAGEAQTTVNVAAQVTVYAQPWSEYQVQSPLRVDSRSSWWQSTTDPKYTQPTEFWPADNDEIRQLSSQYQSPRAIYDYVVGTLNYNYRRFDQDDAHLRLGALGALQDPSNSICLEFTDLFIALARSAGLPSRRLTGYALAQNSRLRPLSLVTDVLHTWPEYYDSQRQVWVPIDPTWAKTTGGVDYFNKLDLRHIVFAIAGQHDTRPLPAGMYKVSGQEGKDVEVQISTNAPDFQTQFEVSKKPSYLPTIGLPTKETLIIENKTGSAAYNVQIAFGLVGEVDLLSEPINVLPVVLPFEKKEVEVELTGQDWLSADQAELKVLINEQEYNYTVSARRALDPVFRQTWVLGAALVVASGLAGGLLVFVLHRLGFVRR